MSAIQFAHPRILSRKTGCSASRTSAYNARQTWQDEQSKQTRNYGRAGGLLHHEIILPPSAGERFYDRALLWAEAQLAEKRRDAQLAKEVILALPNADEVSHGDRIELARRFATEQFASKGVAVQVDIHEGKDGNPHAHLLVTLRRIEGDRLATHKARDLNPAFRHSRKGHPFVTEDQAYSQRWADLQNAYFRERGYVVRVDPPRIISAVREAVPRLQQRGAPVARHLTEMAALAKSANAAAARDPTAVLAALTKTDATFTGWQLRRFLEKHVADADARPEIAKAVISLAIRLYDPESGQATDRYTSKAVRDEERQIVADAAAIRRDHRHAGLSVLAPAGLHADQKCAFEAATGSAGLTVITGRAGVGKTTVLSAVRQAHSDAGYRVVAIAPTNAVAADLRAKSHFSEARTAHSALYRLRNRTDKWNRRTVVIVDEAAMLGTPILAAVVSEAKNARAKLILSGDDRQLGPVRDRGGMFREFANRFGSVELTKVIRQNTDWMRTASEDMAAGRFQSAVQAYANAGALHWSRRQEQARAQLVAAWGRETGPVEGRFVVAFTNRDVDWLAGEIHAMRRERGELGEERVFATDRGPVAAAPRDRIVFSANDKRLGIHNGALGTIEAIRGNQITARLDDGAVCSFDARQFQSWRLGYSGTVHRAQGRTLDVVMALHSWHWNASASYVSLTRHRERVEIFASRQVTRNTQTLARQMARGEPRMASLAFATAEEAPKREVSRPAVRRQPAVAPERSVAWHRRERAARIPTVSRIQPEPTPSVSPPRQAPARNYFDAIAKQAGADPAVSRPRSNIEVWAREVERRHLKFSDVVDLAVRERLERVPPGATPDYTAIHERAMDDVLQAIDRVKQTTPKPTPQQPGLSR